MIPYVELVLILYPYRVIQHDLVTQIMQQNYT
jgi:hypothetical protein